MNIENIEYYTCDKLRALCISQYTSKNERRLIKKMKKHELLEYCRQKYDILYFTSEFVNRLRISDLDTIIILYGKEPLKKGQLYKYYYYRFANVLRYDKINYVSKWITYENMVHYLDKHFIKNIYNFILEYVGFCDLTFICENLKYEEKISCCTIDDKTNPCDECIKHKCKMS